MGKLLRLMLQTPEWLRLKGYQSGQIYRRFQILFIVLQHRVWILLTLILVATLVFWLDALLYPFLSQSPVKALFDQLGILQEALAAIVAGLSAVLGLLVTIYIFTFQLSAERFNATDPMLSFFRDERVGNIILDFLTFSITFSLLTLFALGVKNFTPYISLLLSLVLGIASILLIVVYFHRAIGLTQPRFIFVNISGDIIEHLNYLNKKVKSGAAVEDYLRRRVAEQFDLFQEFIKVFVAEGLAGNSGVGRREAAAAEGMFALLNILQRYVEIKRFIPEKSHWFPRRKGPMKADETYSRQRLITQFHIKAWGQPSETTVNHMWLEERLLGFTEQIFVQAVKAELDFFLSSIPTACQEIMLTALKAQEFEILEMVAKRAVFPYLGQISESRYPTAAGEIYNVIWQIWRALLEDDDSKTFLEDLPTLPWLNARKIREVRLPAMFRRDILALEEMLEYEVFIDGKRISPDSELIRYCQEHAIVEVAQKRRMLLELIHSLLTTRIRSGIETKDGLQVANALQVQMMLVRQTLHHEFKEVYQSIVKTTLENGESALSLIVEKGQAEPEILRNLNNETFHHLINLIHLRYFDYFKPLLNLYAQVRFATKPKENETQYVNEEFIVLGGLALLYSEFDQLDEPIASVLEIYERILDLNTFADLLEVYLKHWELTHPWILRYHDYFQPIMEEMSELPEQYIRGPGEIGYATLPDHPSPIIKRLVQFFIGPPMEGATYYLYLRTCEKIGREPDKEAGKLYS